MTAPNTEITPQAGDLWETHMPGQKPRVKEVLKMFRQIGGSFSNRHYVQYVLLAGQNGHHFALPVARLQRFGKRLSTLSERQAQASKTPFGTTYPIAELKGAGWMKEREV